MSILKNYSGLLLFLLITSFALNFWLYTKLPSEQKVMQGALQGVPESKPYYFSRDSVCTDSIPLSEAEKMIAEVNKLDLRFQNKSIFLCAAAIQLMAAQDGFDGIWVRRGLDKDSMIHDIGWASIATGA